MTPRAPRRPLQWTRHTVSRLTALADGQASPRMIASRIGQEFSMSVRPGDITAKVDQLNADRAIHGELQLRFSEKQPIPERKGVSVPMMALARLQALNVCANVSENAGHITVTRCTHPIQGVPDQATCDMAIFPADKTGKAPDSEAKGPLCPVHANPNFYRRGGVDPERVYDASEYVLGICKQVEAAQNKKVQKTHLRCT